MTRKPQRGQVQLLWFPFMVIAMLPVGTPYGSMASDRTVNAAAAKRIEVSKKRRRPNSFSPFGGEVATRGRNGPADFNGSLVGNPFSTTSDSVSHPTQA